MNLRVIKLNAIREGYVLCLLGLLLLRCVGPYSLLPSILDSLLFSVAALVGGLLILIDFVKNIKAKKMPYNYLLLIFLALMFISLLVNRQYDFLGNIKMLVWQAIYFLLIYQVGLKMDKGFLKKVQWFMIIALFIMSVVSLIMFLIQYKYAVSIETKTLPLRIGFIESRLFGAYIDPNSGSVMSVMVICFAMNLLTIDKSLQGSKLKPFLITSIVVQFIYIMLSGSRTGLIVLLMTVFVYGFIYLYHFQKVRGKSLSYNIIVSSLLAVGATIVLFVVLLFVKQILSYFPGLFNDVFHINKGLEGKDIVNLERHDTGKNSDLSNNRFKLWKDSWEIFKSTWLFGTSPRGLHEYAQNYFPNTYIVKSNLDVHNAYLNVLVSTGIFGGLSIALFYLKSFVNAMKKIFTEDTIISSGMVVYILAIFSVALSAFFQPEMILVNKVGAVCLWLFLGVVNGKKVNNLVK